MKFLNDRQLRVCTGCKKEWAINAHQLTCPACNAKGMRKFDRMTIIAGRRFGKSRIGAIAAADEATIPNSVIWCCAPTNPKLHRYVIPAMQEVIPSSWIIDDGGWNVEYNDLRLKNGTLIHFQTLEHPDQGRGQGLNALWIDEVCELTKSHWEVIRPSLAGDQVAFFTTSPRGYDWVYEELYAKAEQGIPGFWGARARSSESANPDLTKEFLDREKLTMSPVMYQQEYEADFVVFQGAVFGGLVDSQILHTRDQIKNIIPEWPKIDNWRQVLIGIDTGADHPFGGVKIISTEKGLVVVGEYLERHRSFYQHANALKQLARSSTAKWMINKNERQGSIELAQHNIYCQKVENDVIAGTERVKSWLHAKQLWFIETACPKTIQQMKAYRYADNSSPKTDEKRKETVFKKDDELPDCIRYAVMGWPQLPSAPPEMIEQPRDISGFTGEQQASIQRLRRLEGRPEKKDNSVVGDFWM